MNTTKIQRHYGFVSLYVIGIAVLLALFFLWGIARNWSCRQHRDRRSPREVVAGPYDVLSVDSGISLTVRSGRKRERLVILNQIEILTMDTRWSIEARDRLEKLAGRTVTVEYERRGLFHSTADDSRLDGEAVDRVAVTGDTDEVQPEEEGAEARGPLVGVVFGETGINLNLAQIEAGYARCQSDAPKEWKKAEEKAKKNKFGIWSEVKK